MNDGIVHGIELELSVSSDNTRGLERAWDTATMAVGARSAHLDIRGRTVLVTGAASGIGAATSRALASRGAHMVLVDVNEAALRDVSATLRGPSTTVVANAADAAAMSTAVETAVATFGSLDVCVANAGIAASTPTTIAKTTPEEFERIIDIDLMGVWRTVRASLPHIVDNRGHVLVTSSVYAFVNGAANAPYAMSKAGVESFGRALRAELAGTGATAGVLYPGWVDTPIIAASHQDDSPSKQLIDLLMPRFLRTPVSPEVVGAAAVAGIEARRARIVVPRRWATAAVARGLVNIATDAIIDRHPRAHRLMKQL